MNRISSKFSYSIFLTLTAKKYYFYLPIMIPALLLKTVLVGLIDSINQSTIAITIYLLSSSQPIRRTLFFFLGIIFSYSLSGLLVYLGLGGFFFEVVSFNHTFQAILGLIFGSIIFAIPFFNKQSKQQPRKYPDLSHPFISLFLGALLILGQIPITIPFLYLMQQLAHSIPLHDFWFFLFLFNALVTLPLWILLVGYSLFHEKARPFLQWVENFVNQNSTKLLNFGLYIFGFLILLDAISYLSGHPIFTYRGR
ncbi:MAG: hypothetical protein EB053_04240 [Chlamydiae bacterium]|nr:hypothetical protein [Chlamydiota bacterium]